MLKCFNMKHMSTHTSGIDQQTLSFFVEVSFSRWVMHVYDFINGNSLAEALSMAFAKKHESHTKPYCDIIDCWWLFQKLCETSIEADEMFLKHLMYACDSRNCLDELIFWDRCDFLNYARAEETECFWRFAMFSLLSFSEFESTCIKTQSLSNQLHNHARDLCNPRSDELESIVLNRIDVISLANKLLTKISGGDKSSTTASHNEKLNCGELNKASTIKGRQLSFPHQQWKPKKVTN